MDNYAEFVVFAFDPMYLMFNCMDALESTKIEPICLGDLAIDNITLPGMNAKQAGLHKKRRICSCGDNAAGRDVFPKKKNKCKT